MARPDFPPMLAINHPPPPPPPPPPSFFKSATRRSRESPRAPRPARTRRRRQYYCTASNHRRTHQSGGGGVGRGHDFFVRRGCGRYGTTGARNGNEKNEPSCRAGEEKTKQTFLMTSTKHQSQSVKDTPPPASRPDFSAASSASLKADR